MKYWGQNGAVIQCLPFPSFGIAGHKLTHKVKVFASSLPKVEVEI